MHFNHARHKCQRFLRRNLHLMRRPPPPSHLASLLRSTPGAIDAQSNVSPDPDDANDSIGDIACERRRSHREAVVAIGRLEPIDQGLPSLKVLVTDVSLHGCDFRCDLPPSQVAAYRIELHLGPLSMTSRLRVTRFRRCPDGTFEIGAEFV